MPPCIDVSVVFFSAGGVCNNYLYIPADKYLMTFLCNDCLYLLTKEKYVTLTFVMTGVNALRSSLLVLVLPQHYTSQVPGCPSGDYLQYRADEFSLLG